MYLMGGTGREPFAVACCWLNMTISGIRQMAVFSGGACICETEGPKNTFFALSCHLLAAGFLFHLFLFPRNLRTFFLRILRNYGTRGTTENKYDDNFRQTAYGR